MSCGDPCDPIAAASSRSKTAEESSTIISAWTTATSTPKAGWIFNHISRYNIRGDFFGGLTAAVIALPMALAFGVASGAGPAAGLCGAVPGSGGGALASPASCTPRFWPS